MSIPIFYSTKEHNQEKVFFSYSTRKYNRAFTQILTHRAPSGYFAAHSPLTILAKVHVLSTKLKTGSIDW